jgi:hypothetical protein
MNPLPRKEKKITIIGTILFVIISLSLFYYSENKYGTTLPHRVPEIIGTDADNDGVRDDVEAYIDTTYQTVEGTREKLVQLVTPEQRVKESFESQGMLDEYNRRREKEKTEIYTAISTPADVSNLRNALRQEYRATLAGMLANTEEEVGRAADLVQYAAGCSFKVISKPVNITTEISHDLNKVILNTPLREKQLKSFYQLKLSGTAKYQNHSFDVEPCDFELEK